MDYTQSFSVLNERLRPKATTNQQLYSSLTRMEGRQLCSLRSRPASYRPTVLPTEPEPKVSVTITEPEPKVSVTITEPEEQEEPEEDNSEQACLENWADLFNSSSNFCNFGEEGPVDEDRSSSSSEEKENTGELTSEGTGDSSEALDGEGGSCSQRGYINRTLPDLINSGRPLSRRRTLGHVSETLKEVRREVELTRKRSIKLKAQVDRLHESRDVPGWSKHRERVTEEVLSVLRLLSPLTESQSSPPEPAHGENRLDASLSQLQSVARKLAISHTKQIESGKGNGAEDSAVLQQALRDRDEAIERKKGMEAELLRSKTEMMLLNNQLLEAVQKRLELSLEVESWKEDVQLILQQQLQCQQQAEQAQKKSSRMGILRRSNKPPIQRPTNFPLSTPVPPTTNSNQIFIPKAAVTAAPTPSTLPSTGTQRTWRDKLRRAKTGPPGDQDAAGQQGPDNGFQIVSLD